MTVILSLSMLELTMSETKIEGTMSNENFGGCFTMVFVQ